MSFDYEDRNYHQNPYLQWLLFVAGITPADTNKYEQWQRADNFYTFRIACKRTPTNILIKFDADEFNP